MWWALRPAFNALTRTIPIVLVDAPSVHTEPHNTVAWFTECSRCQWAVRRGALTVWVMKRGEFRV